jgi:hypothetical protein
VHRCEPVGPLAHLANRSNRSILSAEASPARNCCSRCKESVVANEALEVKGTRMSIASPDLDFGAALHFSDVAIVGSLQCP